VLNIYRYRPPSFNFLSYQRHCIGQQYVGLFQLVYASCIKQNFWVSHFGVSQRWRPNITDGPMQWYTDALTSTAADAGSVILTADGRSWRQTCYWYQLRVREVDTVLWFCRHDVMDAKSQANVLFYNVADTYKVVRSEGIACFFTVHPSILPGIRHIVGIYPVNWQSTKEFIICDWSPMPRDYQPDEPLDSHLQFSGVCQTYRKMFVLSISCR